MSSIRDLSLIAGQKGQPATLWRDQLLPASFKGVIFHVESGSKESGRRIVLHQFPKKDVPYAEDMGREAKSFSVRGYCICFPYDTNVPLYQRDYRVARDALIDALENLGAGNLQLPTFPKTPLYVVCNRYRITEEERFGGYCVFDMQFQELGFSPTRTRPQDPTSALQQRAQQLRQQVIGAMNQKSPRAKRPPPMIITGPVSP